MGKIAKQIKVLLCHTLSRYFAPNGLKKAFGAE